MLLSAIFVKSIADHLFDVPRHAPVMILPETTLFPHTRLPLLIFEARYRMMLQWALENDRMFCIAQMRPGVLEAASPADFHHVAGLGFVRVCVGHEDGTSHLVIEGLARVELTAFPQQQPFPMAELRALPDEPAEAAEGEILMSRLRHLCAELREKKLATVPAELDRQLKEVRNPSTLGDFIARTFVEDARIRQELLEERGVAARLARLIGHLEALAR